MNYSHYNIVKRQKELKSSSQRLHSMLRLWVYRLLLVALILIMVSGSFAAYGAYQGIISTAPSIGSIDVHPTLFSSTVYYADGTPCVEFAGAGTNKAYAPIEEIPQKVRDCFVAMEDERFYQHNGVDVRGIFRAAYSVIISGGLNFGASTITQQLLKNQVFEGGNEKSSVDKIVRKVQEQYLAVHLEDKMKNADPEHPEKAKEAILEYYLNSINLGNGAYGIASAAQRYFGKTVGELTISEAAVIAPIAYSPTYRNPLTYEDENRIRRSKCLDNMLNAGLCTQEEYDEAVADTDDVYRRVQQQSLVQGEYTESKYSYFVDELIEQIITDLQEKKGYSKSEANRLLYCGGLSITSTQDPAIQAIMDSYFTNDSYFPNIMGKGENEHGGKPGSYYELSQDYALSFVDKDGKKENDRHYHFNDLIKFYADFKDSGKIFYHEKDSGSRGISGYTVDIETFNSMIDDFVQAMEDLYQEEHPGVQYRITEGNRNFSLQPQAAMVIMDQKTGHVLAQYGGRGEKVGNRVLNRASNTYRQAGSTFKVLASFLPAIDSAGYTLASTFDDAYYQYANSEQFVKNWWGTNYYEGLTTIRKGIWHSMNVVAIRCMEAVGPSVGVDYLQRLGFSQIDTDGSDGYSDYNVSIALGGLTKGCSVLEMTAGYAAIANDGVYNKPRYYTQIIDHDGNMLINNIQESSRVMKSSTAWLLTSAMLDTTASFGTGSACALRKVKIPVAGKTGTAHDAVDLWFAGFTPYYCSAIWTGYDNNLEQVNTTYYRYIWRYIMEDVHQLKNCKQDVTFAQPANIEKYKVCSKCGNLAVPGLCDAYPGGNCIIEEYFARGTQPYTTCTCHVKVAVCAETGMKATSGCNNIAVRIYLRKEESQEIRENHGTADTAYILPASVQSGYCTVHSGAIIDPNKPLPTKAPTPTPDPDAGDPGAGVGGDTGTPDGGAGAGTTD